MLVKVDKDDDFPGFRDFMLKCGEMGIHGMGVSEEYGGNGPMDILSVRMNRFLRNYLYIFNYQIFNPYVQQL